MDEGLAAGGYFERIADRPGLSVALASAIRDLKEACYDPDSLMEAARSAGLLRHGRTCKFGEIVRIWKAYQARLEEGGWADSQDAMAAAYAAFEDAREEVSQSRAGRQPQTRRRTRPLPRLILYGFYDLNALQKRIVAAHIASSGATVFFPFTDTESFDFARPTLAWFESLGLARVDLATENASELRLPPVVRILSAPGEAREAREDVRELSRLLDEGAGTLQDVGILLRRSETYSELFADEVSHLGASPYVESPPPIVRSREARSLVRLGEAVQGGFGRVELIEFLGLADLDRSYGSGRTPSGDWKKACLLAGITSGAETWIPRLDDLRERLERAPEYDDFAGRHRHLVPPIARLIDVLALLIGRLSEIPHAATISDHLDRLLPPFIEVTRDTEARSAAVAAAEELRALSEIAGEIPFPYFMELLRSVLERPAVRSERFGQGGPTIVNLMSARGLRFGAVVVPGLVERQFPSTHRQDPILLDRERERLNRAHRNDPLRRLSIPSASVDEEKLLFRLAAGSARDVLVLSFPRLDPTNARPRVPSVFLLRALGKLTGRRHDYEELSVSEHVRRIPLSRRFPEDRRRSMTEDEFDGCSVLRAISTGDPFEIAYLLHADTGLRRRIRMEEIRWSSPFFTQYDGATTSDAARAAVRELSGLDLDGEARIAPTTLEDYARCPFVFLMRHVLGIETLEEPEEALALTPLERGSLYHGVLETFLRGARDRGKIPLGTDQMEGLLAAAERATKSDRWSIAGTEGTRELELRRLLGDLALWLSYEIGEGGRYEPRYFEARFGGRRRRGDDPDLSTEEGVPFEAMGGVKVRFRGKIDRVDVTRDKTAARVIDYKTGKAESGQKKVLDRGRRLQLPVYLLAAKRMLAAPLPDATVEAAEYRYVSSPGGTTSLVFTREQLESASEDLSRAVGLIMHGIRSGFFPAYPPDPAVCRYCEYAEACGSAAVTLARIKNGDRQARFFIEDLVKVE
jgi:RecB family exonuclease